MLICELLNLCINPINKQIYVYVYITKTIYIIITYIIITVEAKLYLHFVKIWKHKLKKGKNNSLTNTI